MLSLARYFSQETASNPRAQKLFDDQLLSHRRKIDRMFASLMAFQWIAGVCAAFWISPLTWIGYESATHIHVWAAILLGGAIAGFPIFMTFTAPGSSATRQSIAIGQMLTSGLLVHLTGGRIETHFHYFGSLAFLAFYRDWRVLVTATIVATLDHLIRGIYWPQSIFGVFVSSHWRWLEHAGWVIFEVFFLLISVRQSLDESLGLAQRQAQLEGFNETIERTVQERTLQLETIHRELEEMSRSAGMAQVATNVLHNVGNVLNSVNVSTTMLAESTKRSKISSIPRVVALLKEHEADMATFMSQDPRGKQVPSYLAQLSEHLLTEQEATLKEIESLRKNIDHIKMIVSMQQNYAKTSHTTERLNPIELIEDSIRMNVSTLARQNVQVIRDFHPVGAIDADKHKVLQILVNLIKNASQACTDVASQNAPDTAPQDKRITIRITKTAANIQISITDNGMGIAPENINKIFNQGFTTKKDGHGFGLHSAANTAKEMAGSLTASSQGPGTGATFTLTLPVSNPVPTLPPAPPNTTTQNPLITPPPGLSPA